VIGERKSVLTLDGSVGGRGILVDAHDERRPVQRAGRWRLEREQPVVVGGGGVRPRRERYYVVRRGLDEHLMHVGHVLLARPVERERGRLVMVVMMMMMKRVGGGHFVAATRVVMVVMVVVWLRCARRRVVRSTAAGRGGRRLSAVTSPAAATAAEHVHVGHLLQGAGPGTAVRPRWTGIPRFHHQISGIHGRLDQSPGTAQRRGRRQRRRERGHRGGGASAAGVAAATHRRRRRR